MLPAVLITEHSRSVLLPVVRLLILILSMVPHLLPPVYNNLAAGTHTVEVTDANGCIFATTATVTTTAGPTAVVVTQLMLPAVEPTEH